MAYFKPGTYWLKPTLVVIFVSAPQDITIYSFNISYCNILVVAELVLKAGLWTLNWTMDWVATHSMQYYAIQWKHPAQLCLPRNVYEDDTICTAVGHWLAINLTSK